MEWSNIEYSYSLAQAEPIGRRPEVSECYPQKSKVIKIEARPKGYSCTWFFTLPLSESVFPEMAKI